ncbi:hypothetical protein BpHYR1_042180 [Brachionus plicatilis]|uniref:Uncharacterized protein n=1 Tax=Brachionus plicatilis TaxID=10195 RepID=A0A3M7SF95_BRAPC|nr:hypothetical protein BpHYR1_042180 [Brachionus plicatilis]
MTLKVMIIKINVQNFSFQVIIRTEMAACLDTIGTGSLINFLIFSTSSRRAFLPSGASAKHVIAFKINY